MRLSPAASDTPGCGIGLPNRQGALPVKRRTSFQSERKFHNAGERAIGFSEVVGAAGFLALAGVVGPILYVVVFTLAGFLRPGYSPVRQSISTLGVGANAWLLNTDAMVFGVLLLAFAIGFFLLMQQVIEKGKLITCLVLLTLSSIGAINTGLFPAGQGTAGLHWTFGFLLGLLPLVIVYTITGWQWLHVRNWHGYGWYSLATALGSAVFIVLSFVLLAPRNASGGPSTSIGGLIERALILVVFAWHVVVGWHLFTLARSKNLET